MQFTQEELNDILEKHKHWCHADCDGWKNMKANLSGADLSGADLSGVNLWEADLYETDLSGANLCGADLYRVNLFSADLRCANLSGANLRCSNLNGANLRGANLTGARILGARLRGAILRKANLSGANLSGADLYGAKLSGAKNVPYIPTVCPDTGSFIGWKKAWVPREGSSGDEKVICIIQLEIPEDAKRSSATTRKCRCDKALVKSIEILEEGVFCTKAYSYKHPEFVYEEGKIVSVDDFDEDRFNECSAGIHFFINRQEAIDYNF